MKTLLLLILLAACGQLAAQERPTAVDHVMRVTSTTLIAADWLQTVDGIRHGMREFNPILGPHPSLGTANLLIGSTLLANAFVVPRIHARDLRYFIWGFIILVEVDAVLTNHSSGLRFNFRF